MIGIILAAAIGAALYFGIRYALLKSSIQEINNELDKITRDLKKNRILKLPSPQRELEMLLSSLNHTLEQVRQERISYEKREQEFQRQLEDISHDLRTPLTAIQGYLKLIGQKNLDREEKEYLEVIRRRSAHLQHLINQFYEFSTLLSGSYKMEFRDVDLARMCREQLLGYYRQLEEAGIEVQIRIPEKPVFIRADEYALSRIIGNLLQNAARYAKHRLEIEITETQISETMKEIVLICANDAEYLKENDVQQMFQRFYTGDHARSQGGTGLGLAISRHLAEQMGGTMTVESERLTEQMGDTMTVENRELEEDRLQNGIWLIFKAIFPKNTIYS